MSEITIILNEKQLEVDNATEKEIFYISGRGGGKSFELGQWILDRAAIKESIGLIAAPTHDVIKLSTLPQIQESWEKVNIIEGKDYVINEMPPEEWGVEPLSSLSNTRIITFRWGSYCVLDTLENVNKARGAEYDYIAIDEFRDVRFKEVRKVLLASLRGRTFKKIGKKHQILWASTPPDDPTELNDLLEKNAGIKLVEGSSYDNRDNLPENYIEDLESQYDPITAQREIYGQRIFANSEKRFMYAFENRHISNSIKLNERDTVYLSFDFNVDPITCILAQIGHDFIHILDEFRLRNSDLYAICEQIKTRYGEHHYVITGDASGFSRHVTNKGNRNNYSIILQELGLSERLLKVPKSNPPLSESKTLCNSIFARHPNVFIHERCKHLILDNQLVQVNDKGEIDKSADVRKSHLLDCERYLFNSFKGSFIIKK